MVDVQGHSKPKVIHTHAGRGSSSLPIIGSSSLCPSIPIAGPALARKSAAIPVQPSIDLSVLLSRLIQIAANSYEPSGLLAQCAIAVGEAFQADGCTMVFFTSAEAEITTLTWLLGSAFPPTVQKVLPPADFIKRFTASEPASVSDVQAGLQHLPESKIGSTALGFWQPVLGQHPELSVRAVLDVTMQFRGNVNGLISLMRSQPYDWSTTEAKALKTIAQQVASTLAQLQIQHQIAEQTRYQSLVNQLTLALRNTSNLSEILQLATDGTAQALGVQRGLLLRLKYVDPLYRNRAFDQIPRARITVACEWLNQTQQPSSETWQAHRPATGLPDPLTSALNQSFWMADCEICQRAFSHSPKPTVLDGYCTPNYESDSATTSVFNSLQTSATLVMPLESQGTILGLLVFEDSQPRTWRTQDIELVELVGAQVSTAIIQTETLRQVQALVEKRTAELQQSLTLQAKLYERTREQVEQLRHLNQLKDEFLDAVSHELRTPLTKMTVAIRMLQQEDLSGDRQTRYLKILEQECTQETNLVNDLLALRVLESKKATFQPEEVDVLEAIHNLALELQDQWSTKGIMLEIDCPQPLPKLRSDRDSLNRVLLELMTNAGKYSEPNSQVYLSITYQPQPTNQFVLSLTNTGAGIAPEELPHIFDKFRRCSGATQKAIQGTGLGLALVQSLVQHLNGTISVSSNPKSEGVDLWETCFTLLLPQSNEDFESHQ